MVAMSLAVWFTLLVVPAAAGTCKAAAVDFILLNGDTLSARIEDDIRADLAQIGVSVTTRLLEKADFNRAMSSGDFNLCFTESWGPPYDPHSFAASWAVPNNEAHYPALSNLDPPMTMAKLLAMVKDVTVLKGEAARMTKWREILEATHKQAVSVPLWSKRNPAVINRRLTGYNHGSQQWDYPMHTIEVLSGSKEVRVAPAAQTGLFKSIGRMDPHSYRPNEFFLSNWVYEGLVSYGPGGSILPSLAVSWTADDLPSGGQTYIFELRRGVYFHDGTPWDCAAAKLNFDHVLAPPLPSEIRHGWYHLPGQVSSWGCTASHTFFVSIKERYYPFLQELTFIRPLRMLSPAAFAQGSASDPTSENSCPTAWGTPTLAGKTVRCAGIRNVSGTGPWMFKGTTLQNGSLAEAVFVSNVGYWGSRGNVEVLRAVCFETAQQVKDALLSGGLDMVVGAGVLPPVDIAEFRTLRRDTFMTMLGPRLMNTLLVLNTQKAPTDDIRLRTAIMHALNKAAIIDKELAGLEEPATSLFPDDAPYCDVDLTPRWDYDFQKASLLNCPEETVAESRPNLGLILGLSLGLGLPVCLGAAGLCYLLGTRIGYRMAVSKDKRAQPLVDEPQAKKPQEAGPDVVGNSA